MPLGIFLSTLSLRRATRPYYPQSRPLLFLSTLSLRRATVSLAVPHLGKRFLSTLSLRRATVTGSESQKLILHFYPHSPCGERRNPEPGRDLGSDFYPHSPCGERPNLLTLEPSAKIFLSTLSLRRATVRCFSPAGCWRISIHTLLAESDVCLYRFSLITLLISIHTLLAESDYDTSSLMQCQVKFLSTLSLRRATRR